MMAEIETLSRNYLDVKITPSQFTNELIRLLHLNKENIRQLRNDELTLLAARLLTK